MASTSSDKKSSIDWQTTIISSLFTFIVTVGASFALYYYTLEKPSLRYEQYPPSSFITDQNKTSIINAKIENTGDKEAEDVVAIFKFKNYIKIQEASIELSSSAIKSTSDRDTVGNILRYNFPTLNSGEKCSFSFLLKTEGDSLKNSDVEISLRGKGVNGQGSTINNYQDANNKLSVVIPSLFGLLLFMGLFSLILVLMIRLRKVEYPSLSDYSDNELDVAVKYCNLGLFDESIRILKNAIYLNSSYSPLHANLARAYANQGSFDLAFFELKIAENNARDEPDNFINNYVYAQVYSLQKEYDTAIKYFALALNYDRKRTVDKALADREFIEVIQNDRFSSLLKIGNKK